MRRTALALTAAFVLAWTALACGPKPAPEPTTREQPTPPAPAPAPAPVPEPAPAPAPGELPEVAGVHYLEIVTGGARAEDPLPMIIAIHGLGDSPEGFAELFESFASPTRLILPRALDPHEPGWSWFPYRARDPDVEKLAQSIAVAADALAPALAALTEQRPTIGKPILTGFSQGGMLSFTLALHHGELFSAVFPVGGWLPPPLMPGAAEATVPEQAPPIVAFHGDSDKAVIYGPSKQAVDDLAAAGYRAELRTYPGVGHAIPPAMRAELLREITAALPAPRPTAPPPQP